MKLSRIDRIQRVFTVADLFPQLAPGSVTSVAFALLPARSESPVTGTVWTSPISVVSGSVTVLLAGPEADSTGALVVPATADLWAMATNAPETEAVKIPDRISVAGSSSLAALPTPFVTSVNGKTGAAVLGAADVGADAAGAATAAQAAAIAAIPSMSTIAADPTLRAAFDARYAPIGGTGNADNTGFDIVLLLGQSNMSGRGTPYDAKLDPVDGRVWQYGSAGTYASVISQAAEPLAMWDTPTGIGPGLVFARWYAASIPTNRRVLLVPVARGGTPFEGASSPSGWTWKVGRVDVTNLYEQAITQAQAALTAAGTNAQIVAALWVQGETDGDNGTTGATYQADLDALIVGLRSRLSLPNLPFVIGEMVPDYLSSGTRAAIDSVQRDTPNRQAHTAMALGPAGANMGDGNHYNASGQRTLGRSMFTAYRTVIDGTAVAPTQTAPSALTITATPGNAQVTITATGGSAATSFKLYRGATATGTPIATSFPYTDTGLTNGTSYSYVATASNNAGSVTSNVASATPTAPAVAVVTDSFTRADSTTTLGTADTGQTWTVASAATAGTYGISGNKAYHSSTEGINNDTIAVVNSTKSDANVQVTFSTLAAAGTFSRFVFRCDGTIANYWMLQYRQTTGKYQLYKRVSNSFTQVGSDLTVTPASGDVITAVLAGNSITIKVNGTTAATATDAANSTNTWHGIGAGSTLAGGDNTGRYDDFSVTA